jgi:hypothetical protein
VLLTVGTLLQLSGLTSRRPTSPRTTLRDLPVGSQTCFSFLVALLRTSYRLALAVHVGVWLLWGWAIWHEWDITPALWLVFGISMLAVFTLRNRLGNAGKRSTTGVG